LLHLAKKVYSKLDESRRKFSDDEELPLPEEGGTTTVEVSGDDALTREQLQFVYKISKDIDKTAAALI
jgi:hypothetical protein